MVFVLLAFGSNALTYGIRRIRSIKIDSFFFNSLLVFAEFDDSMWILDKNPKRNEKKRNKNKNKQNQIESIRL